MVFYLSRIAPPYIYFSKGAGVVILLLLSSLLVAAQRVNHLETILRSIVETLKYCMSRMRFPLS